MVCINTFIIVFILLISKMQLKKKALYLTIISSPFSHIYGEKMVNKDASILWWVFLSCETLFYHHETVS